MSTWSHANFSVLIPHTGVPAKEWLKLQSYLRRAREAEEAARKEQAAALEAEAKAAGIAAAVKNVDILETRIRDRVSKARRDFTGRAWLAKEMLSSLQRLAPNRAILITGIGGMGKSYFFDRLLDDVTCHKLSGDWAELNRLILARHCCMHGYLDSQNPRKFLDSLIGQVLSTIQDTGRTFTLDDKDKTPVDKLLCDHLKTPKHTDPSAIVAEVLVPALRAVGGPEALGGKCIMLVDSLDEAQRDNNNTIVPVLVRLIQQSPGWVRWVATSRPHAKVKAALKPVEGGSIELSLHGENQEADVREYVEKALDLPPLGLYTGVAEFLGPLVPRLEQATIICKKAKGLFQFAAMAVEKLAEDPEIDLDALPAKLEDMYLASIKREYGEDNMEDYYEYAAPKLAMMVSLYDAVSVDMLIAGHRLLSHVSQLKLLKHKKALQLLLRGMCQDRLLTKNVALVQLRHKSFADFLKDEKKAGVYAVSAGQGHMLLADRCREVLKVRSESTDLCIEYSLRYFVHHLCYLHEHPYHPKDGSSRPDPLLEAAQVLLDLDWLLDRLLLDKDTQGVVEDMKQVSSLLQARGGDGDAKLAGCIDAVGAMADRARRAVRHDPRYIVGWIMTELSDDTRAPVANLVERASECKRFRWWYISKGTLTMGGEGQKLTCVGERTFIGECNSGMGLR